MWLSLVQEVQPHQPEAVAVLGHTMQPTCLSSHITLDDLVASLRLEQGEVAAALVKTRDSLQEQARLQCEYEAKQAAAAAALLAAEKAKPKARQASSCMDFFFNAFRPISGALPWFSQLMLQCVIVHKAILLLCWPCLEGHLSICSEAHAAAVWCPKMLQTVPNQHQVLL